MNQIVKKLKMHLPFFAVLASISASMAASAPWNSDGFTGLDPQTSKPSAAHHQKRFPEYHYPDDLDLSQSFPVTVAKGRDLLLPLQPLHHALFPDVEPPQGFSLGFSVSACSGSMAVAMLPISSGAPFDLSTNDAQCFTFTREPNETTPSLCPLYFGADERFYRYDPRDIQGIVLMADLDADLLVMVSFTSTATFSGFNRMFNASSPLHFDISQGSSSASQASFDLPSLVSLASSKDVPCVNCTFRVFLTPSSNESVAPLVLPAACVAKFPLQFQLESPSASASSANVTAAITSLSSLHKGWYHVYLVADLNEHAARPALLVYPPQTAFFQPDWHWTYIVMGSIAAVGLIAAVVAAGKRHGIWLNGSHKRRSNSRRSSHRQEPSAVASMETDEHVGLLSKTNYHTLVDDDEESLDGYDEIPHYDDVTVRLVREIMAAATSAASWSPTKLVHLREEHRKSLQSNVEQFKHLQTLSKKPVSPPQPTTLRVRATNLASQDEIDRNAAICRAVLVLWTNIQKMRCLRRWRDVTNYENQRIHDTAVRTVQQSTRELLAAKARGDIATYSSEQVALLVEWAVQTKSFDGIDRHVLEDVVQHMHLRQLKDKECLFFEGDVGLFYYFLFTGSMAIYVDMPPAAKATLASSRHEAVWNARRDPTYLGTFMYHIPEGDGFGEVAMFNDEARRTASAVAAGPCELIEIPKPVYVRTLLPHHFAVFNKAQKMAFLPSVDVFADWIQAKIAGLSDLMERHDLAFGHRLVVADRPIQALFIVISGEVRVTQPWLTPVAEHKQAIHTQLKQAAKKYIDVEVERVGRRGYVGLPLLLFSDAKSISKVDAVVSTNVAEVYILKRDNLEAYRALMPANGTAQVTRRSNDQQRHRTERYLRTVSVLQQVNSAQPPEPQPATVDEEDEQDKLPLLPIMVSSSGKKFLFPDWDLLVDRSDKPVVMSMAAPPSFVHIDPSEQRKIAAQSFTTMSEMPHMFQWDPPHGFTPQPKTMSLLVPKAPPRLEKPKDFMPTMDKTLERSISRTRQLARAVVKEHNAFVKSRAIVTPRPSSFKHSF